MNKDAYPLEHFSTANQNVRPEHREI